MERFWVAAGALLAGLGVAAGAFATHGLRDAIPPESLATWETGARYQVYHGLALLAVGLLTSRWQGRLLPIAGGLFLAGVLIFSGGLYLLATTGPRILGAIVPIGGAAFLAGWGLVALAALRGRSSP
jgi:uncharacterized membrane protein YgdD (TMEM256/DUF423 family)